MQSENCSTLTIWFLDQLPGAKTNPQLGSFQKQVGATAKLVGTKKKPGKWTVRQVKRALRSFRAETGKMPTHLGVLDSTWFAPNGATWMEYANTPPPMPPAYQTIALTSWLEEWGDTLEAGYRRKLEAHISGNLLSSRSH